jgi:hypothetical protein
MSGWRDWLILGRISNLPTVWSNVLAGTLLAGNGLETGLWPVLVATSLFYEAGMLLNDAFDRNVDGRERPERPIPSGRVAASTVFTVGYGLLALGWVLLWPFGSATMAAGGALAVCIVAYNVHHKGVAWSPCLMGACRALAYLVAGYATSAHPDPRLYWAGLALASYVAGLSYAAKQENLTEFRGSWPLVLLLVPLIFMGVWLTAEAMPLLLALIAWTGRSLAFLFHPQRRNARRAVEGLIAGIALVDAVFAVESGSLAGSIAAVAAFALTHYWQRQVPGT